MSHKNVSFSHYHNFGLFGTHDEIYGNIMMIGKTTVQINLKDGHQTKQSKAKQLHGQMELNNPMPGFLSPTEAGPNKWNE
jgi:hypothetical protein